MFENLLYWTISRQAPKSIRYGEASTTRVYLVALSSAKWLGF